MRAATVLQLLRLTLWWCGTSAALRHAPPLRSAAAAVAAAAAPRRASVLPRASAASSPSVKHAFDVETAVTLAGFAFEAYNEPSEQDARWERGADGCDVAFMSEDFAREFGSALQADGPHVIVAML